MKTPTESSPKIESGIPIPPRSEWAALLDKMKPGDSVVLSVAKATALRAQARYAGVTMTSRTEGPNLVRIWRSCGNSNIEK